MTIGELIIKIGTDLSDLDEGLSKATKTLENSGRRITSIGKDLTIGLTLPIAALGTISLKAATQYETALANVAKVTGGSKAEVAALSDEFRKMSETIPLSASELANLGATAAQLGIETKDIGKFTEVMSALGVTTNLSAEEAATSIAQLANITGLAADDFDNLGSAVLKLGVTGAATERQIVEMSQRIAGAGVQVGLTEQEILAFASAVADTGIEVEAGGSAISKIFQTIAKGVAIGGDELAAFARISGQSASQFKKSFEEDAAGALIAFITGLGKMKDEGKSAIVALDEVGLADIRTSRALLSLAADSERLTEKVNISNDAWKENTALVDAAATFYGTTQSQLKVLGNQIKNVAIDIGDALIPILKDLIQIAKPIVAAFGTLVDLFTKMPKELQGGVIAFAAILAAMGPVLVIVGSLITSWGALTGVAVALGVSAGALALTFGLIPLAIAAIVAGGIAIVRNWQAIKFETGRLIDAFVDFVRFSNFAEPIRAVIAFGQAVVRWFGIAIDVIKKIIGPISTVIEGFAKMFDKVVGRSYVPDMVAGIKKEFGKLDAVMVKPTRDAINAIIEDFRRGSEGLSAEMDLLARAFDRQADLIERIKQAKFDALVATTKKEQQELTKSIAEMNRELTAVTGFINSPSLAKLNADLRTAANTSEEIARLVAAGFDTVKINIVEPIKLVNIETGLLNESMFFLAEETRKAAEAEAAKIPTLVRFQDAMNKTVGVLAQAGKQILDDLKRVGIQFLSALNPVGIATSAFSQALFKLTGDGSKFGEAMNRLVKTLADALQPAFDALAPIIDALAPILKAVAEIFGVLFKALTPILSALVPLLRALFPVFKFLAIIATYVGQIFAKAGQIIAKIISVFAVVIGNVIVAIGKAIDILPFISGKPIINFGKGLINAGHELDEMSDAFGDSFKELGEAREEIKGISLDEPIEKAGEGLTQVGEAAATAAINIAQLGGVAESILAGGGNADPSVADPFATAPSTRNSSLVIESVTIQTSGDGVETYNNLYTELARRARSGTTAARDLLNAFPAPN